jgi:hypothetical protein
MLTYHNDPELKKKHIEMAKNHLAADMLRAGSFGEGLGEDFKGCSVGCFAYELTGSTDHPHKTLANSAGWPLWLVYLNDTLFEGLNETERLHFHVRLREAVPVGKDISKVLNQLIIFILDRNVKRLEKLDSTHEIKQIIDVTKQCRQLHVDVLSGVDVESSSWSAVESAARSAEWSAARSAEWSAVESAARAAARSAALSAAESAAESAARAAAMHGEYADISDKLIELLEAV